MSARRNPEQAWVGLIEAFSLLQAKVISARPKRLRASLASHNDTAPDVCAPAAVCVENTVVNLTVDRVIGVAADAVVEHTPVDATVDIAVEMAADVSPVMGGPAGVMNLVSDAPSIQETVEDEASDWATLMAAAIDDIPFTTPPVAEVQEEAGSDDILLDQLPFVLEEVQELVPEIESLLMKLGDGSQKTVAELHRKVHTLKGTVGQVGAMRARTVIHEMETVMEEMEEGRHNPKEKKTELLSLFATAKTLIKELESGNWGGVATAAQPSIQAPKTVRVNAETVDMMVSDVNESRLASSALEEILSSQRAFLKDLEEGGQRASKMLREFEIQSEMQIQSRRTQLQELGEEFDPLELDRFSRVQELSRSMAESLNDVLEVRREILQSLVSQEAVLARQRRAILSTQEKLHKSRLTQFDAINDRLYGVVWGAARETGKAVSFEMTGGRTELDRVLLEKVLSPLEHILRNSVAHGIESASDRAAAGKPKEGTISIRVRQEAGRALIDVNDDGYGLRVGKIKDKAVEKGVWRRQDDMDSRQAAELICSPGFSTAESVSQIAGRGVGMDVVRSEILGLGGRFEIVSEEGKGLRISIQLPTSIASASVLVVEAGQENWAFPIEMVDHVIWMQGDLLQASRSSKSLSISNPDLESWQDADFVHLSEILDLPPSLIRPLDRAPVLLVRERGRVLALEVEKLLQVADVPLRAPGSIWSAVRGVAGTVVLPSGDAVFLLDPFRAAAGGLSGKSGQEREVQRSAPLVMVVDDSLTVRKATTRFLLKNGYECVTAKDGQEALEMLVRIKPSVILLDVEMPRMDGFETAKNIREGSRSRDVPIIMITSRTADKHRRHAFEIGVNDYMGKPFKEDELLAVLKKHVGSSRPSAHA